MSEQTVPASRTVQIEFLPIGRRILSVVRVEDVTPRMRRIVLAGDDLGDDFPCFPMHPNDHVKLCFPDPQSGELVVPRIGERGMELDPEGPQPIFRDYTVRGFDPKARELTIDFVLHDHGIAGVWAGRARPGDVLGVLGPRGTHHFPTDYRWYLVAGDETALPAIGRWVEELPAGAAATVVVEVAGPEEEQQLSGAAEVELRWVHRDPAVPDALERALREVPIPDHDDWFAFVAGEAGALKPIRRWLRRELGLPKERLDVDGYWKKGTVNLDHHVPDDEDD